MAERPQWEWEIRSRLEELGLPPEREAEIVEELAGHLEDEYQSLVARQVDAEEARRIAIDGLNGNKLLTELRGVEDRSGAPVAPGARFRENPIADLGQDLRYAARVLRKSPGFTILAVFSLALGIGGNSAMFRMVSAVLVRPLPFPEADRLVEAANDGYFPSGGLVALQRGSRTTEFAGFNRNVALNLTGQGEAWRLTGSSVSANLFRVLGVQAGAGRTFHPAEDQPGRDSLIILSDSLWVEKFHRDPAVIGKMITLGGVSRQVVGVMSPDFAFPDAATQFWIPLHLDSRDPAAYWAWGYMPVIGRIRDGATLGQAQREIRSLVHEMVPLFPYPMPRDWNSQATLVPLKDYLVSNVRTKLIVLQCAIGLVLLVACANVANLLLARAATRQKEMAVRVALGAARGRIVRQLLTESVVLAFAGGILGIALASGAFSVLTLLLPAGMAGLSNARSGWPTAAFGVGLSFVTGLVFGLAPAISASRHDLANAIRTGGQRSGSSTKTRLRGALIVGEVALAVMLAVGAGLLIKSLCLLTQVDPGFRVEHVLTLRVSPNESLCRERASCIALFQELMRRTAELPGIDEVAAANTLPLDTDIPTIPVAVEGHPILPGQSLWPMFWSGAVTPEYFRLMRIPILAGRAFTSSDGANAEPVAIVSAAMARRYWPGENPIGKHLRPVFESGWRTIVGVSGDVRQYDLANHSPTYILGDMYMPYPQSVMNDRHLPAAMTLMLRTGAEVPALPSQIRALVSGLNPNVPVSEIRTMESQVNGSTQSARAMTWLFAVFAGAALLLAAIGTYGVVSYSTTQRTFEIGMRMTLGASRRAIFELVLGQSLRLVIAGLAIGVIASLALAHLLTAFLYGTAARDLMTFCSVCAVLVAVALIAGYLPARRAAALDPLAALRVE